MQPFTLNQVLLLVLLLGATVIPVWLGLRLRRTRPGVLWIGVVLCLLFGPLGQIYVKGWWPWFFAVLGICLAAQQLLTPEPAMLVMIVSSPLLILFRMRK